jgi:hypothetical protein
MLYKKGADEMKNLKWVFSVLAIVVIFGFMACDNDDTGSGKLRNIDIVGAKALMIVPASSMPRTARAAKTKDVFLKQLEDGSWVRVLISDEAGGEITMEPPTSIKDATNDWMIIGFYTTCYLVRKSTGDAYDLRPVMEKYSLHTIIGGSKKTYYEDKNSNFYLLSQTWGDANSNYTGRIIKISPGSTQATAEAITSDIILVSDFAVDNEGNIMYTQVDDLLYNSNPKWRIRTADGTILPLDEKNPGRLFFTGYDGYIYGIFGDDDRTSNFFKLEISGNTLADITITPVVFDNFEEGYVSENSYFLYFSDRIVLCNFNSGWDRNSNQYYSFYKNGTTKCIASSPRVYPKSAIEGKENVFIWATDNRILTVNTETGSQETIVSSTEYDQIYRYEVTANDIIIINALTFDGKKILANIYPDGRKEILSESMSETETLILTKVR